ncbi:hypothetical protein M3Y97_00782700 [Aphelenchoides bicaudatus]|nr:hypothetical protein M3Y97_00782700 [Aphelenchoides bicaudatus]
MKRNQPHVHIVNDKRANKQFKPVTFVKNDAPVNSLESSSSLATQEMTELVDNSTAIDNSKPYRQFVVIYAKRSNRKRKQWEGDGILKSQKNVLILESFEQESKRIAASYRNKNEDVDNLGAGSRLFIAGYEVEISEEIFQHRFEETTVLCEPSNLQRLLYDRIQETVTLDEATVQDLLNRLYCHPAVLHQRLVQLKECDPKQVAYSRLLEAFLPGYDVNACYVNESGKLNRLLEMVVEFDNNGESAIVASSSKCSLDIIETMFKEVSFDVYRIDGQPYSNWNKVSKYFDEQERDEGAKIFLFYTGMKACSSFIKSASRLVLFDTDSCSEKLDVKNKIWRGNENKTIKIHRFVTKDTLEVGDIENEFKCASSLLKNEECLPHTQNFDEDVVIIEDSGRHDQASLSENGTYL